MTVAFPLPSPDVSVQPSGLSSHVGHGRGAHGDFTSITPSDAGGVEGELKSVPYQRQWVPVMDFPPLDYAIAEKSLRDYCASLGEDFDALVKGAGARSPGELKPWRGEPGSDEINDMVLGDDEAVGGDLS